MRRALLAYLVCPLCRSELSAELAPPETDGHHMSGQLSCERCARVYRIVDGIPQMVVTPQEPGGAATTFTYEWRKHGEGSLETETLWGRTREEELGYVLRGMDLRREDLANTVILDAGCGSGRVIETLGHQDATAVVGVDVHGALGFALRRSRDLPNVHVVRADILALPFRPATFDLVYSSGVIHHLPNPRLAFDALAQQVRTGGKLYVWVYERRRSPFVFVRDLLERFGLHRVPLGVLFQLCKVVAVISLVLHGLYRAVRALPPLRPHGISAFKTTRYRSRQEFELTWFDALSPRYAWLYDETTVRGWFTERGFGGLVMNPHPVGVCGIKTHRPAEA